MVRYAMGRGLPAQAAEDVVAEAWERATAAYRPERGAFEALLQRTVQRACASWWRRQSRFADHDPDPPALRAIDPHEHRAAEAQRQLLAHLSPDERRLFATWALQKHLPRGVLDARKAAARLGLDVPAYNAAKKRLARRILALASELGLSSHDLLPHADDEGPRRARG